MFAFQFMYSNWFVVDSMVSSCYFFRNGSVRNRQVLKIQMGNIERGESKSKRSIDSTAQMDGKKTTISMNDNMDENALKHFCMHAYDETASLELFTNRKQFSIDFFFSALSLVRCLISLFGLFHLH